MKTAKILLFIWVVVLVGGACSAQEKATAERKNLMMPKQSELKRNDKYKPAKEKKTYSTQKKKKPKNH